MMLAFIIGKFSFQSHHHERYSSDEEWDTQPLSHVKGHWVLEIDLGLFDKFNQYSWAEDHGAEKSEEESGIFVDGVFLEKECHQDDKDDDAD